MSNIDKSDQSVALQKELMDWIKSNKMIDIEPSKILKKIGVLRWKSQINGVPKLQGVYKFRDQEGFPLDMTYEISKEMGYDIDWVEALADAGRQCIFKYDALIEEIKMLEPDSLGAITRIFMCGLMSMGGDTFRDKSYNLHKKMGVEYILKNFIDNFLKNLEKIIFKL